MSADNYYFVRKREDGKFGISHRSASAYYSDECDEAPMEGTGYSGVLGGGWKIDGDSANEGKVFADIEDAMAAATRRPDWFENPPEDIEIFDDAAQAVMRAHQIVNNASYPVEYGVSVGKGVI